MIIRLLSIVAPVFACMAIGFVWGKSGREYDSRFVTRLVMDIGAPFLVVSSFTDVALDRGALASVGLATLAVLACVAAVSALVLRLAGRDLRTYLPSLVFHNSGNMGLPLCLFAFGRPGLSLGIVVFLIVATLHFSVGVGLVSGSAHPGRLVRTPLLWAAAVAVAIVLGGWTLPTWLKSTVDIMAGLAIPLMLLTLGVTLSKLRVGAAGRGVLFALLRFALGFGAGVLVTGWLGLSGVTRGVVVLQASMPSAVFNYMLAERYDRGPAEVAGIVVMTTFLSLVVLPAVLWYLLR